MSQTTPTPEQVIAAMTLEELQELLAAMRMDPSETAAKRLRTLVAEKRDFEVAIGIIAGPATMKRAA
ncbi:MAG: hypothetical protein AAGG48_22070 [Planctomycetota bacterium]